MPSKRVYKASREAARRAVLNTWALRGEKATYTAICIASGEQVERKRKFDRDDWKLFNRVAAEYVLDALAQARRERERADSKGAGHGEEATATSDT